MVRVNPFEEFAVPFEDPGVQPFIVASFDAALHIPEVTVEGEPSFSDSLAAAIAALSATVCAILFWRSMSPASVARPIKPSNTVKLMATMTRVCPSSSRMNFMRIPRAVCIEARARRSWYTVKNISGKGLSLL
jgi:hypothetical protein